MLTTELPGLEIVRPLGEGSVAHVLLAREPALKRLVAVKVLWENLAADDTARRRFEREGQTAASLSHPNVTSVYRVGHLPNGIPYIVMEYIDGRTLEDLLAAKGPLNVEDTRRAVVSVAHALAAAHRKHIVHRDVRPNNVMCETESGRIVLMDFGIAGLLETGSQQDPKLTRTGERLGDVLHMSPEQTCGEPTTQQSDVYCLGVLAHELLTGRVPGAMPQTLLAARPDVDVEFADVVRRCLAPNPRHRPTASEVAETLLRVPGASASASLNPFEDFLRQLQQRKVFRVAIAYMAGVFILLQAAQLIIPALPVTDADLWYRGTVAVSLAGFPIALVLSWVFDWTPGRVRRAPTVALTGVRRLLPVFGLTASVLAALGVWLLLM
ncbi:MAG: serine/threonine-protein kinase [Gemmatimonadota bacterium]